MTPELEIAQQIRPKEWAEAIAMVGWPVVALAFWYVFWRYNPWRKGKE